MSNREVTNVPASVRARLLALSKDRGESFDQVLVNFSIERFLYRLSQTPWSDRLVVKGAIMLRALGTPLGRPTRDIDFLGSIDNRADTVTSAVRECLGVEYAADGLVFESEIATKQITVADRYPGVRAVVRGHLDGARFTLQLDIGIDDVAVPEPEWVDYPTILPFEAPRILAYQPATAVAEKFEAMVSQGVATSRMKDFYDIWLLSRVHGFDGRELSAAIRATFNHRGTRVPERVPIALTSTFHQDDGARDRWRAFITKGGIEAPQEFGDVCHAIEALVMPAAVAAASGVQFPQVWLPDEGWTL